MRPWVIAGGGAEGSPSAAAEGADCRLKGHRRALGIFVVRIDNRALGAPCFAEKRWPIGHIVVPLDQRGRRPGAGGLSWRKGTAHERREPANCGRL